MEHYDDNEEFKGGGRISPERSATDFPKGTLGVGENGNVWINQPDKNGRLSWKATEITKDFGVVSFGNFNKEEFLFEIIINGKVFFYLRYNYDKNNFLRFTYPNGGADFQIAGNLEELLKFFNENFVVEEFDLLNTDRNFNGEFIQSEVRLLFGRLRFLINKKGLRKLEQPPEPKFKIGDKVKRIDGTQIMTVVKQNYSINNKEWDYDLVFEDEDFNTWESYLELYDKPKYTFKVGDKIKIPKTKYGDKLVVGMSNVYDEAIRNGQDYLFINVIRGDVFEIDTESGKYGDYFNSELDEFELYEEEVPQPKFKVGDKVVRKFGKQVMTVMGQIYDNNEKMFDYDLTFENGQDVSFFENQLELYVSEKTAFQQIDFLNPSTEELDVLIKGMQNYSDDLHFINSTLANIKLKQKDRTAYIEILFDKVNNIIKLSEPSRNINVWSTEIQQKITNESISEISELYIQTLTKLLEYIENDKPKDCETDPSLIVSGQVKKFYDLNKTRIEKLKSEFSCKIIKALVSLSEYEKCGTPSKIKLPLQKEDLLSEIKNLKF